MIIEFFVVHHFLLPLVVVCLVLFEHFVLVYSVLVVGLVC